MLAANVISDKEISQNILVLSPHENDSFKFKLNDEKKLTKNKKEIYGQGNEAKMIREELGNFDVYESEAYKRIIKQYGRSIRFSELIGIINAIKLYLEDKTNNVLPPIKRNEKRSFPLLIKYIQQNNELIFPYLQYISLCNSSFQKIPLDTKDIM